MKELCIENVIGREVLDSRGNPTVEVEVHFSSGVVGKGLAPSGASTGKFEAVELRDTQEKRYLGKGVLGAVEKVNTIIKDALVGKCFHSLFDIDQLLIALDGTEDKSKVGANAILATSIACAQGAAMEKKMPLYQYIGGIANVTMPVPMMNIINGGAHAANSLDVQEFMIVPVGATSFKMAVQMCAEVFHALKKMLKEHGLTTAVGDEGGYAPELEDDDAAIAYIMGAIKNAGYEPGIDFMIAIDAAASEWKKKNISDGKKYSMMDAEHEITKQICYKLPKAGKEMTTEELIEHWVYLVEKFPIISIEDPLDEEDWMGWKKITERLGYRLQLVGDDLFVTNTKRLQKGINEKCGNAILIKPNQIGSLSETMEAVAMAKNAGYKAIVSHRSGETEDTTIADLAVGLSAGQIKTGAPSRSERVAKYNQLIRIEEQLGHQATYPGKKAFQSMFVN